MKLLKMGLMVMLLSSGVAYSVNPMQSWYGGIIVGGSKAADISFSVVDPLDLMPGNGVIDYSVLGKVGGHFGYRFNHLRAEGELFYNNNAYKHMEIDGINIPNTNTVQTVQTNSQFTFNGYTNTFALMLNGFYDFYIPDYTENFVPYVGVGIGYEHVQNYMKVFNNGATSANSVIDRNLYDFAAQGIVGMSYYVSDYTSFAFDFRYLSALRADDTGTKLFLFQYRPQIYSVNFVVNVAFNLA